MSDVRVRPAQPADADAVTRVYVESWNVGFGALVRPIEADAERRKSWRETLAARGRRRWWVAERHASLVGFAGIGPSRDPRDERLGELDTIAVSPTCWRSGVGRALMQEA